jgi:hypothetical protein
VATFPDVYCLLSVILTGDFLGLAGDFLRLNSDFLGTFSNHLELIVTGTTYGGFEYQKTSTNVQFLYRGSVSKTNYDAILIPDVYFLF